MARQTYSEQQIETAVDALSDAEEFAEATRVVTSAAPGLQRVLLSSLQAGGWFEEAHTEQLAKAAEIDDLDERLTRLRVLLAEETQISMMIGVAAGWALLEKLQDQTHSEEE